MFVCTGSSLAPRTRCIPSPACGEGIGRGHATRSRGDAKTFTCARSSPRQPSPRKPRAIACGNDALAVMLLLGPGSSLAGARSSGTRHFRVPGECSERLARAERDPGHSAKPRNGSHAIALATSQAALPRGNHQMERPQQTQNLGSRARRGAGSRRLGIGIKPSRCASFLAALRARRTASAFSRVLRSDGFS